MQNNDTIKLLRECDSGVKMGISSIDEVLDHVKDSKLLDLLKESKSHHEKLAVDTQKLLAQNGIAKKEPSAILKGMSWIKINVQMGLENSDNTIADLMTQGCNMGVKSLNKYLNEYKNADNDATSIAKRLIVIEKKLVEKIECYL